MSFFFGKDDAVELFVDDVVLHLHVKQETKIKKIKNQRKVRGGKKEREGDVRYRKHRSPAS